MHPITYKRENGEFDVNWYLKEDRANWVLPKVLREQAQKLGKKPFLQFGYKKPLSFYQTNRLANRVGKRPRFSRGSESGKGGRVHAELR